MTQSNMVTPPFYTRYIRLVDQDDVNNAISASANEFLALLKMIPREHIDHAYEEGKWTIKQLLQHVIDAERVFAYRALTFARKDGQALPGFDENAWASNAAIHDRDWNDMIMEFEYLRKATALLFQSFGESELKSTGTANNNLVSVVAIGYVCAGHVVHHMNILRERYLK